MSKHRSYGEGSAILPPSTIPSHLTSLGCDPDFQYNYYRLLNLLHIRLQIFALYGQLLILGAVLYRAFRALIHQCVKPIHCPLVWDLQKCRCIGSNQDSKGSRMPFRIRSECARSIRIQLDYKQKKADRLCFGWLFSTLRSNYGKEIRKSPFM